MKKVVAKKAKGNKVSEEKVQNKFVQKITPKQITTVGERSTMPYIAKSDLIVPRIQLMQAMSDKVAKDGSAKAGELRENLVNDMIADVGEKVTVVPVHARTIWLLTEERQVGKKVDRTFKGIEELTPENEMSPFEEELEDGGKLVRTKQIEVYCLLESDPTMPFIVSFAKTSLRAGKKMLTQMYMKNQASGLDPSGAKMWIASKQEQGDQGAYYVMDVGFSGLSKNDEVLTALKWYKSITSGQVKVSESSHD